MSSLKHSFVVVIEFSQNYIYLADIPAASSPQFLKHFFLPLPSFSPYSFTSKIYV